MNHLFVAFSLPNGMNPFVSAFENAKLDTFEMNWSLSLGSTASAPYRGDWVGGLVPPLLRKDYTSYSWDALSLRGSRVSVGCRCRLWLHIYRFTYLCMKAPICAMNLCFFFLSSFFFFSPWNYIFVGDSSLGCLAKDLVFCLMVGTNTNISHH